MDIADLVVGDTEQRELSRATLWTLLLIAPLSGVAMGGMSPILPQLSQYFAHVAHADMLVRLLVTSVGGAMIFGSPLAGLLCDFCSQRKVLSWSLLLYALFGSSGFFVDDIWLLLLCRIAFGVISAIIGVICISMITAGVRNEQRHRWIGYYSVAGTLGVMFLFTLVGFIAQSGWRVVFLVHIIAMPISLLALAFLPTGPTKAARRATAGARIRAAPLPWWLIPAGLACGATSSTVPIFLPFHLSSQGADAAREMAIILTPFVATIGATAFFYGAIRSRIGLWDGFVIAFFVAGVGVVAVALSHDLAVHVAGMMVSGFGLGLLSPNLFAAVAVAVPPGRQGRAMGLVHAGFYGGPLSAQMLLEPVMRAEGAGFVLLMISAFTFVMSIALFVVGMFASKGVSSRVAG